MARINKVLIVFLHFGTPWPYFVCALCQFIAFGTRRDNTLYVRCATFRTLAHAATILCMCVVPLSALRHTSRQYSVCALCRFSRSGTRPDHTLYVRCANFRAPAHVATILCMCHVPLFALRHTLRQEKAEKCRKGCNSCNSCISCSSCISCNSCSSRIVCRRCRFPARSFANKKLILSCRIF